ncbi:MAG: 3-phosphoshikimate 1-carboxyvinyltransferase, partial [Chloroflexi bacterium]
MLRARGVAVRSESGAGGSVVVSMEGGGRVQPIDERVPADVSAAAFWLVAAAIHPDAELTLRNVGVNPTRRAVIDLLRAMGADIDERPLDTHGDGATEAGVGEPRADLVIRSSQLRGIDVGPAEVAAAIDEIPVLCLAAAVADGP